jgi:hypothetical protein
MGNRDKWAIFIFLDQIPRFSKWPFWGCIKNIFLEIFLRGNPSKRFLKQQIFFFTMFTVKRLHRLTDYKESSDGGLSMRNM